MAYAEVCFLLFAAWRGVILGPPVALMTFRLGQKRRIQYLVLGLLFQTPRERHN